MNNVWRRTLRRVPRLLWFIPIYMREMTLSNLKVAIDAFRPIPRFTPGFVEINLAGYDPIERWEAVCLISMTPGTLALDMEEGSDKLLVHSLYLTDPEQTRSELEALVRSSLGKPRN